jgi:hypothetical protein
MTPAERQRAYNARLRKGIIILPVRCRVAVVSAVLRDTQILKPWEEDDRERLAAGVARLLEILDEDTAALRITTRASEQG